MHITSLDKVHYTVVFLSGRLDVSTSDDLDAYATTLINEGKIFLIIECSDLDYISSSGLGALLHLLKEIDNRSGKLLFTGFSPAIGEVITISGFDKQIESYKTLDEAHREIYRIKKL